MSYNPEVHGPPPPTLTRVWVLLGQICIRSEDAPHRVVADGLDLSGRTRGLLSGWHRSVRGDWLGVVNFYVPYADGRRSRLYLSNQLVPAYALRPRDDSWPI